ncbi:hypothetical protein H6F67_21905 [Microcoleus sp. FACHB-1515]|uniref:hypothetical protein n=1 Tax=Cyanophyceae TaxID=3028117 RepID=UPI00168524D6|nr:hypothetical protein [Microcoleus sp. FACHB-1515]MBD2092507.1 hypothetical protein [Microcoleus sp. FACHB-1515]
MLILQKTALFAIASGLLFTNLISNRAISQPVEPNLGTLSLTCRGTIQNSVDFTAFYTREGGFNRVEFRPRTSTNVLTSNLRYSGKNTRGQGIWRGAVAAAADVVLVHLSDRPVQSGDQVSIGYDGRWGRATCR